MKKTCMYLKEQLKSDNDVNEGHITSMKQLSESEENKRHREEMNNMTDTWFQLIVDQGVEHDRLTRDFQACKA
jgi:hypothetical protein